MAYDVNSPLWVEKYRPQRIQDCVLPDALKETLQAIVSDGTIPNLIFAGGAGTGKTTAARALCAELDCDSLVINGSMNGNIDTLRNEIRDFASTMSFSGGRKYVILDEADYLNPQSTQPALRNFMEEYSSNCGFILTCNFVNKIIDPLHSRCSVVNFTFPKAEMPKLAGSFMKRVMSILESEEIEFDKAAVAALISKHAPDWRRVLNELQRYSVSGKVDAGILTQFSEETFKALIGFLKERKFDQMRKWVAANADMDPTVLYRKLYDSASVYVQEKSIPQLVMTIAQFQFWHSQVADVEINLAACLTELMADCEWK